MRGPFRMILKMKRQPLRWGNLHLQQESRERPHHAANPRPPLAPLGTASEDQHKLHGQRRHDISSSLQQYASSPPLSPTLPDSPPALQRNYTERLLSSNRSLTLAICCFLSLCLCLLLCLSLSLTLSLSLSRSLALSLPLLSPIS